VVPDQQPLLNQLNMVVGDMEATVAFYRRLGLAVEVAPGGAHATARMPNGLSLEFDTRDFVPQWDSGWNGGTGGSTVLGFGVASREAVEEIYADLTQAGYRAHQMPYDAFWGARYAIVDDPDGNGVGIMSPAEESRKFWPPGSPPAGC
jgi:catechol 2,3-dioxygenase-like lactoylglutathione lyase family enzyme